MELPSFKIDLSKTLKSKIKENISDVLDSGMFATGKYVREVEDRIKEKVGVKNFFAVSSGTSALESAAYAFRKEHGVGKVLIPANTFLATSLAFERLGFETVFYCNGFNKIYDADLENYMKHCVGAVFVDLGGNIPQDVKRFIRACRSNGLWVCEDACQAYGSTLKGKHAGTFADIGAYSFFATKVVTGGEGGAVLTDNPNYAYHVKMYRNFGKDNPWVSYHYAKGWNCRMGEFSAAVLLPQIEDDKIINNRKKIRKLYGKKLNAITGLSFNPEPKGKHSFNGYKIIAYLAFNIDKSKFIERCAKDGVKFQGNVYDWTLPEQPVYLKDKVMTNMNEVWLEKIKRMICMPSWYGMTEKEINYVIKIIKKNIKEHL